MKLCASCLRKSSRWSRPLSLLATTNWWKLPHRIFDCAKECSDPTNGQSEKRFETQNMSSIFLDALATPLYPVTDRTLSGLSHAEQVSQLSENGVTLVQLREKTLSPLEFFREAAAALQIAHERGMKIII